MIDYNMAVSCDPNNSMAYYNRGLLYYCLGNMIQAIANYDMAIKINPKLWQAYNNRGLSYEAIGNVDRAIWNYQKAFELNPRNQVIRDNLNRLQV